MHRNIEARTELRTRATRLPTLGGGLVWTDRRLRHGYRVQIHAWLRGLHRLLDPSDRLITVGSARHVLAAFDAVAPLTATVGNSCVVALHGLGRSRRSFDRMAARLTGVELIGLDYASVWATPAAHGALLAEALAAMEPRVRLDVIGFSMGALVARYCLARLAQIAPERFAAIGRLVQIAPPNRGAALAEAVHRAAPGMAPPALRGLARAAAEAAPMPPVPTYVIAGDGGPRLKDWWEEPNDGLIRVSDTRLEGMVAHVTVRALHALMLRDEKVIRQTAAFLERPLPVTPPAAPRTGPSP